MFVNLIALFLSGVVIIKTNAIIRIDGIMDSVWQVADSVTDFKQYTPDYGKPARYRTVVKFLQDRANLYVLAIAYTGNDRPEAGLAGSNDRITIYLDPLLSRQDAYYFKVHANGGTEDGIISDNGTRRNDSWDGFWYGKARVYDHKYIVEMKIPYRTIRYKKDSTRWGLQIARYVPRFDEVDYWRLPEREHEGEVSSYGILEGVNPGTEGKGMEFYPVALVKSEEYYGEGRKVRPHVGFDFNWNITSSVFMNTTVRPDFAQIEADPFALNLSKYELYLSERRPFFIEANEVFKPVRTTFGDIFQPFTVFYSRRIGRKLPDGTVVPILFGGKFTMKTSRTQIGYMGVYTEGVRYSGDRNESAYFWNVFRFKINLMENSPSGVIVSARTDTSGTAVNLDLDGKFDFGDNGFIYQVVGSRSGGEWGTGMKSAFTHITSRLFAGVGMGYVGERLNLSATGYLRESPGVWVKGAVGGWKYPEDSRVVNIMRGVEIEVRRDRGEPVVEKNIMAFNNYRFRGGYYLGTSAGLGNSYESGMNRTTYWFHLEVAKMGGKAMYGAWNNFMKNWNYRLKLFGWINSGGIWSNIPIRGGISFNGEVWYWMEFGNLDELKEVFVSLRPGVSINIDPVKSLVITTETVPMYQDVWKVNSFKIGVRFEYTFRPKSKFYMVFNREYTDDGESFKLTETIFALKARWAIPF